MWQARSNAIVPLALAAAMLGCGAEETRPTAPPAEAPAAAAPAAEPTVPAPPSEVMQWQGELPEGFPGDVPQYPGSKVTSAQGSKDLGLAVTFDSPDALDAVAKFYADSLAAMGWQTQTRTGDGTTTILADKEGRILQLMIQPGGQGTLVDLIVAEAG